VLPEVQQLLKDPDLNVRTEAMLYLAHHAHVDPVTVIEELGDFADFSVRSAVVAYLAHPGEAQNSGNGPADSGGDGSGVGTRRRAYPN